MDGILLVLSKVFKRLLFFSIWDWLIYLDKVLGCIFLVRGVNWLVFDFCVFLLFLFFVFGKYELECRFDIGFLLFVFLFFGDLEVVVVFCDLCFFKGGFEFDFFVKFEEFFFKMFKVFDIWGFLVMLVFLFDVVFLFKVLGDLFGK